MGLQWWWFGSQKLYPAAVDFWWSLTDDYVVSMCDSSAVSVCGTHGLQVSRGKRHYMDVLYPESVVSFNHGIPWVYHMMLYIGIINVILIQVYVL